MFADGIIPDGFNGSVCSFNNLLPRFEENYNNFDKVAWQYFGTTSGATIFFPAIQWMTSTNGTCLLPSSCPNYDPRKRPWYNSAITGPKNIVMVIDVSVSMGRYGKLTGVIAGISNIFNSLTSEDYINIVVFNDNATICPYLSEQLYSVTSDIESTLMDWLNSITPSNGTNFINAYQKAFNILNTTCNLQNSACNNIIIFATDGYQDEGLPNALDFIKNTQFTCKTPIIFTYSIDVNADNNFNKEVACMFNGSFYQTSTNSTDITNKLSNYLIFLRNSKTDIFVYWTDPYTDFTLGVGVVTAAVACSTTDLGFIGVTSTDILVSDLSAVQGSEALLETLETINLQFCNSIQLNSTEAENLRESYAKCSTIINSSNSLSIWLHNYYYYFCVNIIIVIIYCFY